MQKPSEGKNFVTLRAVDVARGDRIVLHEVNLSIAAGEHVAILGPNGCGKSTLIKTITCECYPLATPEMQVSIFGRERWVLEDLRRHLGVVSAELPGRATARTTGLDAAISDSSAVQRCGRISSSPMSCAVQLKTPSP